MMTSYDRNIYLEDRFWKRVARILGHIFGVDGECFVRDPYLDRHHATDLYLLTGPEGLSVGLRLRRYRGYPVPPPDFTIRWKLPSGKPTEIDKIRQGDGRYLFYGIVDPSEQHLVYWSLLDLDVFRREEAGIQPHTFPNKDARPTWLAAYPFEPFAGRLVAVDWTLPHWSAHSASVARTVSQC